MHAMQRNFLLMLYVFVVAGCAQLGLPKPETFNQKLLVGVSTVTEVRKTSTALLEAKKINSADHENIEQQADNARAGLEIARTLAKSNPNAADAKLTAVRTALTALQTYLATRK